MKHLPRIALLGNCQMVELGRCLQVMLPDRFIVVGNLRAIRNGERRLEDEIGRPEILLRSSLLKGELLEEARRLSGDVVRLPDIRFEGFHPDAVVAEHCGTSVRAACGLTENSAIALYAWSQGLSAEEAVALFRHEVLSAIGYLDGWERAVARLVASAASCGLDVGPTIAAQAGCFMHAANHPKLGFTAGIARLVVRRLGLRPAYRFPENFLVDCFPSNIVWPIYPDVGDALSLQGDFAFKFVDPGRPLHEGLDLMSLTEFVQASFARYEGLDPAEIRCVRFTDERFLRIRDFMPAPRPFARSEAVEVICDEALYDRSSET
jgi:hypothetical protein